MSHFIYLVRHGEQQDAEFGLPDGPLSERGKRQAAAIADRLASVPFTGAWHSPLQRAAETAEIIQSRLGGVTEEEIEAGSAQMADAVSEFLTPARGDRHDLLVTHNFVISWFVREVLDAPSWRWLGINQANAGLTIIRVRSAKPPALVTHNDLGHLPPELRTGLPVEQPY